VLELSDGWYSIIGLIYDKNIIKLINEKKLQSGTKIHV